MRGWRPNAGGYMGKIGISHLGVSGVLAAALISSNYNQMYTEYATKNRYTFVICMYAAHTSKPLTATIRMHLVPYVIPTYVLGACICIVYKVCVPYIRACVHTYVDKNQEFSKSPGQQQPQHHTARVAAAEHHHHHPTFTYSRFIYPSSAHIHPYTACVHTTASDTTELASHVRHVRRTHTHTDI